MNNEKKDRKMKDDTTNKYEGSTESYRQKIEGAVKINFGISSCPVSLYEEFKLVCKKDFADTYHLALRYLLDLYKGSREIDNVWEVIHRLSAKIDELEMQIVSAPGVSEEVTKDRPEIVTFGKKSEEKKK